jgi:hypothetical protein
MMQGGSKDARKNYAQSLDYYCEEERVRLHNLRRLELHKNPEQLSHYIMHDVLCLRTGRLSPDFHRNSSRKL